MEPGQLAILFDGVFLQKRRKHISKTPLGNTFINCGWGTGGFKAIPGSGWATAEMISKGEPGPLAADFRITRFREGQFIDESVAAGVAH